MAVITFGSKTFGLSHIDVQTYRKAVSFNNFYILRMWTNRLCCTEIYIRENVTCDETCPSTSM